MQDAKTCAKYNQKGKQIKMARKLDDTLNDVVEQGLQPIDQQAVTPVVTPQMASLPQTREQLEILEELASLEKSVTEGIGHTTKPTDLAASGVVFDITDAWFTTMVEDDGTEATKVCFQIVEQNTGIVHTVMQSNDSKGIRGKYATLYTRCKALGIPREPLKGYRFVMGNKVVAGNKSIILERAADALAA